MYEILNGCENNITEINKLLNRAFKRKKILFFCL